MKANQASQRTLQADDRAVSAVIGAVLVLAVVTIALVEWRLEWVPVLEGETEAGVALLVDSQMGALRAHFNDLSSNATTDAAVLPVKLGAQDGRAFAEAVSLPNALEMRATETTLNVTVPSLMVFHRDGKSLSVVGNNWTAIPSSVAINDVSSIQELRWRIGEVNSAHDTRASRATIFDADANFAGSYEVLVDVQTPHLLVHHLVRNADSELITSRVDSYAEASDFRPYFVDLLDRGVAFEQVLKAAQGPFTLVMAQDPGFSTDYIASYSVSSGAGRIPVATSGIVKTDHEATIGSGALVYTARNSFYPSQEMRVECGAIVVRQDGGNVFRSEPLLRAVVVGDRLMVDITAPRLVGEGGSVSGDIVANVVGIPLDQDTVVGATSRLNFTIQTQTPGIWASLFQQRLEAAGLSDQGTQPGFTVLQSAAEVHVEVFGPRSNPASISRDIVLRYQTASILVDIDT